MIKHGENNLKKLVKGMSPILNKGEYVYTVVKDLDSIDTSLAVCIFKEAEGITLVINRNKADELGLKYEFIASWITLQIHSSLESTGLTAIFSSELAKYDISCNVIAGFYHDHIFVPLKDSKRAIGVLKDLTNSFE